MPAATLAAFGHRVALYLQMGDSVNLVADPSDVDMSKIEPERTPSSIESTPERDTGAEPAGDNVPPQKRKGGRKPVSLVVVVVVAGVDLCCSPASDLPLLDICYFGGEEAAQPTGASRLQRTSDRIHQAARGHHQAE